MNKDEIIRKTEEYVKKELKGESSGHDWWHIYRVWNNAKNIGKEENADMFVVELASLLHDISDWKHHDGDESVGAKIAKEWLESLDVDEEVSSHVAKIIGTASFKGSGVKFEMKTKEGKIVQDSDRLDAIGAVGIARAFMFAGNNNVPMHDPKIKPKEVLFEEEYKDFKRKDCTEINHFYEKLLLLKDLMNTKTAKKIAEARHKYMEQYLEIFFKEWEGEK